MCVGGGTATFPSASARKLATAWGGFKEQSLRAPVQPGHVRTLPGKLLGGSLLTGLGSQYGVYHVGHIEDGPLAETRSQQVVQPGGLLIGEPDV